MSAESTRRPSQKADFLTINKWFISQPGYVQAHNYREIPGNDRSTKSGLVFASVYSIPSHKADKRRPLPEGQQICAVSIDGSPSNHEGSVFHISMIIDKDGQPIGLYESQFYAWATIQNRDFLSIFANSYV